MFCAVRSMGKRHPFVPTSSGVLDMHCFAGAATSQKNAIVAELAIMGRPQRVPA